MMTPFDSFRGVTLHVPNLSYVFFRRWQKVQCVLESWCVGGDVMLFDSD